MSATLPVIRRCMQEVLQLSDDDAARIDATSTPVSLPNWNSLAHVQIILELERAFSVTFAAGEIASLASVGAMMAALERSRT